MPTRKVATKKAAASDAQARAKVEAYVNCQPPAQQRTINRLRAVVKGAVPDLTERMRWLQVGYLVSGKDVCGIYSSSDHVNLSFAQGATLRDPKGLLEGTGKGIRHIKVARMQDVDEDTIQGYVKDAVAAILKTS